MKSTFKPLSPYNGHGFTIIFLYYNIERVIKLQKKSIRIINNKGYNFHTDPLFKESNILTVGDQYKLNILTFMHEIKNMKLPLSFRNFNYFTEPSRPTRQQEY